MDDKHERRHRDERHPRDEREGGLMDLLRRAVGPRQPAVLVMEPDGRLRPARECPPDK